MPSAIPPEVWGRAELRVGKKKEPGTQHCVEHRVSWGSCLGFVKEPAAVEILLAGFW
jgi:hypothetical protein